MKQNVTTSGDYKENDKWDGIKYKIKVDPTLNQEKVDQLWQLLDQFLNIFTRHKGELGCYKYGEHVVDTQRFPPCRIISSWLSFWEEADIKAN